MGYGTFSFFVFVILVAQISPVSSPREISARSDGSTTASISRPVGKEPPFQARICSNISVIFTRSNSTDDIAIPWVVSILSIATLVVPANRAFHLTPDDRGGKHAMFLCFISFSSGDYMLWTAYAWGCQVRDSAFAFLVSSIVGILICFGVVTAVVTKTYRDEEMRPKALWVWFWSMIAFMTLPKDVVGRIVLVIGSISHCCRIRATDYDRFDILLFLTSASGCVNGFLWLCHPTFVLLFIIRFILLLLVVFVGSRFSSCSRHGSLRSGQNWNKHNRNESIDPKENVTANSLCF